MSIEMLDQVGVPLHTQLFWRTWKTFLKAVMILLEADLFFIFILSSEIHELVSKSNTTTSDKLNVIASVQIEIIIYHSLIKDERD